MSVVVGRTANEKAAYIVCLSSFPVRFSLLNLIGKKKKKRKKESGDTFLHYGLFVVTFWNNVSFLT